jgi:coenzyme F420-reducing hydrogenase alpha subunit
MAEQRVSVDYLPRVEGEGALRVRLLDGKVAEVQVNIFEPPRLFEAFLRGRGANETIDITARICGICPVAYQMSAAHALEKALGVSPPPGVRALRRLLYCGEWIESHVLHVFMLHAPDFLGHESVIGMAGDPALRPAVEQALRMKKIGNRLVTVIAGREIHPVAVCVGGFYRAPRKSTLAALEGDLAWGLDASIAAVRWAATLDYPDFEADYDFVALSHPDEYGMNEGRIVSSKGLDIAIEEFTHHFVEEHVAHSTALHSKRAATRASYMVGPLARINVNFDRLSPAARMVAREIGFAPPVRNPFKSLLARGLETIHAFEEALDLVRSYEPPEPAHADFSPRAGEGAHVTEAPRGILYHRYRLNADALVAEAKIVPPTAQNLKRMEDDLWQFVPGVLDLPVETLTLRCEQLVRSYDPCISCSAHFLKLHLERG